ncbi:MAG: LCP family protein [Desulfitobacteriaceae bacterium]
MLRIFLFRALKKYGLTMLVGFTLGLMLVFAYVFWHGADYSGIINSEKNPSVNPMIPQGISEKGQGLLQETLEGSQEISKKNPEETPRVSQDKSEATKIIPRDIPTGQVKQMTVLLVGVDNRPGENYISNTDTLILTNLNPVAKRLAFLSVPRDTQIDFPGHGKQKINATARLGKGVKTTVATLEDLLGQRISGYIKVNFDGFKQIVDTLGGITVTVEKDMYYNTGDKTDGVINLKQGTQRLNGSQALQYARFRHDNLADISRTMRQQAVLKAMVKEFWQVKTLPKLPWLIPQVYRATETNLALGELLYLASVMSRSETMEIVSQTLPGNFAIEKGISYWKIRPSDSRNIVRRLFEEGKTTPIFASEKQDKKAWASLLDNTESMSQSELGSESDSGGTETAFPVMSSDVLEQESP